MNSRTAAREAAHRKATLLAAECRCLSCHAPAPSMPCHYPTHRGMGSGKAGWDPSEWVPLCYQEHLILDSYLSEAKLKIIATIEDALERGEWPP